jgi:hypothetical protein
MRKTADWPNSIKPECMQSREEESQIGNLRFESGKDKDKDKDKEKGKGRKPRRTRERYRVDEERNRG